MLNSIWKTILFAIVFTTGYYDTFIWMIERYLSADSYYSHGVLIPVVSAYLVWLKQNEIMSIEKKTSWIGFGLLLIGVVAHIFGTAVYVFSISGFSMWLSIVGSHMFLFGWERTKIIWFPIVYLLFMFPVPMAFITAISFPLKMFVANYGVMVVQFTGIPVYQEGFNIFIPQGMLMVGNPCSGLRSLIAFMALGSLFSYLSYLSKIKKMFLFIASIPIAILSNLIRVPILIIWSYKFGLEAAAADTIVHTGSGLLVFVVGLLLIYGLMHLLRIRCEI